MLLTNISSATQLHFRLLEKLSTKFASKKGVQLWLTPPKYQATAKQLAHLTTSTISRIPFSGSVYQPSAETFYTLYRWGSGATVLLLHDWGGSAAQMAPLAKPLVEAGFQVLTFDALAHGNSPGKRTDLTELIDIIIDIESKFSCFHAIVAHSCSAIAAVGAIRNGVKTSRFVLSSAAASIDFYLRKFSLTLKASRQTMGRISASLNKALRRNVKDFSIINMIPNLNLPALLIHDRQNHIVDFTEALALSKLWPECEFHSTDGLGHNGVLYDPKTIHKITDYIS